MMLKAWDDFVSGDDKLMCNDCGSPITWDDIKDEEIIPVKTNGSEVFTDYDGRLVRMEVIYSDCKKCGEKQYIYAKDHLSAQEERERYLHKKQLTTTK